MSDGRRTKHTSLLWEVTLIVLGGYVPIVEVVENQMFLTMIILVDVNGVF
jgi:hypothetical protein